MEEIREIGCGLARKFSLPAVVITGVDHREEGQPLKMGNLVLENGNSSWVFAEKSGGSYSGTGDLFCIRAQCRAGKKIFHENLCRAGRGFYLGIDPGCGGGRNRP